MTDDKDFKNLVREEARRRGRRYTDVRAELRPPEPVVPMDAAQRIAEMMDAIKTWVYGKAEATRLTALALVAEGNVLLRGGPGNGMTNFGQGVAATIGGQLVSIDGRTGLDPGETARWRAGDVVVVGHLDGLGPADQVAIIEGGRRPAIVLAKCHPIAGRMPFPPDDDTRERFLFSGEFPYNDIETDLRIVNETRDRVGDPRTGAVIGLDELNSLRAAAAEVEIPDAVRRFIVEVADATRRDPVLALGASTVATLSIVRAAAAAALAAGRAVASIDDVVAMLKPVLGHRLVFREGDEDDIDALLERITGAVAV